MRPNVLSIAGFDPTGGAGILADIKTFESCKCQGFAIQTANTIQTENTFEQVIWHDEQIVFRQLKSLLESYKFKVVKIGFIKSVVFLEKIINILKSENQFVKIIWDPILKTSSGSQIHKDFDEIETLFSKIFMIVPNWDEVSYFSSNDPFQGLTEKSKQTNFLLKGGHHPNNLGVDYLFTNGKVKKYNPKKGTYHSKHGSGCVFSSSLAAYFSRGYSMHSTVLKSKRYVESFLKSTSGLLGTHYN